MHAGGGEEDRRIVLGNQRLAGYLCVVVAGKEFDVLLAEFFGCHSPPMIEKGSSEVNESLTTAPRARGDRYRRETPETRTRSAHRASRAPRQILGPRACRARPAPCRGRSRHGARRAMG